MKPAEPASGAAIRTPTLYHGGRWQDATQTMPVHNPYDGSIIAHVSAANDADAAAALKSATRGVAAMAALSSGARAAILRATSAALADDAEAFAHLIRAETGKPIMAARREVARAVNTLRLSAEEAIRLTGETIAFDSFSGGEARVGHYRLEPLGLILAITPFNDPLNLACHKLGPAFAGGNAVLLKPAEQAPLTAIRLVKLLLACGLPADAIALLTGRGAEFGDRLAADPAIAMLSFTGGPTVGGHLARIVAPRRTALELGGNGTVIVTGDADLAEAARACASGAFWAAGQNCIGVQQILVEAERYPAFRDLFLTEVALLKVGDPADPETFVGPMIDEAAAIRLEGWIAEAIAAGARRLTGGWRTGAILAPAVLENVPPDARLSTEEAFGPVVCLREVPDLDTAIALANTGNHAIHCAIFTQTLGVAEKAIRQLRCAGVMVNDSTDYRHDAMPFGGFRQGNLGREGVRFALRDMTQTKTVCIHLGEYA